MYWVVELCKSKLTVDLYTMQDYENFRRIMCQCELVSGDMELLAVYDNPDDALRFTLESRISIRDSGCVKTQDGKIIKLNKTKQ